MTGERRSGNDKRFSLPPASSAAARKCISTRETPRGLGDVPGAGVLDASPTQGTLFVVGTDAVRTWDLVHTLPSEAELSRPVDVAAGEGLVAIADAGARRIVVLDGDMRLRRVV